MKNQLVLFTTDFPFGTGETFLETEIIYLSKEFQEVRIITQNTTSKICRDLPKNCFVERINIEVSKLDKIKSLFGLFSTLFWNEIKVIKTIYGKSITKEMISTMLISLYRGKKIKTIVLGLRNSNIQNTKHFFYSYWCDDVALGLALAQDKKNTLNCFSRIHGWDVYFEASSIDYLPFRHYISEKLNAIYSISEKGKEYVRDNWKILNQEKIKLARLGVSKQTMVEINKDNFILVSCSNVIPLKRVELIVRALSEIKNQKITWVHFGDGPKLAEVKALALEILSSNITFEFKGRVTNKEVLTWYTENNPSLFINVSTTEGIPVSIMEAMSFGIPVIATDVGGTGEIVNEKNGMLLLSNPSANEVSHAIELLMLDKKILESKKEQAYIMWFGNYNGRKNYKQFILDFQNLHAKI
jgi:glycosyltransferase involved in cell wall biosynthesis